jgi:uncharacterized membrane protein YraQ (UPF0718 family)
VRCERHIFFFARGAQAGGTGSKRAGFHSHRCEVKDRQLNASDSLLFLISAPMVNEVALVLLYGLFGWKIAAIYMSTGLITAMLAGWTIGRLKMERHLEEWVYQIQVGESLNYDEKGNSFADRIRFGLEAVRDIVGKV